MLQAIPLSMDNFHPNVEVVHLHWILCCSSNLWTRELQWFSRNITYVTVFFKCRASLVAHMVKNLTAMLETWVRSLAWEDLLEKGGPSTPVFWPREFQRLYSSWDQKESDTTDTTFTFHFQRWVMNWEQPWDNFVRTITSKHWLCLCEVKAIAMNGI